METLSDQLKDDLKAIFFDEVFIKNIYEDYLGEYSEIIVKDKWEKYPSIKYPLVTIDEITNEDDNRYMNEKENVSYLAYQIEITCDQTENHTAVENIRRIADIIDTYLKGERYRCLRRIGGLVKSPLISDNNVMVGYLRYECNLDINTHTIYRR